MRRRHGVQGKGVPGTLLPLAGDQVANANHPAEHIITMLRGLSGKAINDPKYKVEMPPFADKLSDRQIPDIIDHERTSWGNHGPLSDACRHCEDLRQETGGDDADTILSTPGYLCTAPATANGAGDHRLAGPILGNVLVVSGAGLVTLSCIVAALFRMVKLAGAALSLLAQH
jgi:hypothetical protein